jgi:RNA polymerase sigma factor (sigma-70 family)
MKAGTVFSAGDLIPTRYSLLSRLQDRDDQESWKDFFDTYWRLIYSVAIKSGLTDAEAQDVVQETVISVAKDIHKFKRNQTLGSFKGWLRNITRWRVADQFRKRMFDRRREHLVPPIDGHDVPNLADIPDARDTELDALWEAEWKVNLFEAAVERVKQRVKGEQYQMFDLYAVKGWPLSKVARTLGVNAGRIYLAKHRISALIKKEIQALEKNPFK